MPWAVGSQFQGRLTGTLVDEGGQYSAEVKNAAKARVKKAHPVGTLNKALRILELICDSPKGVRLKDVSEKTGFKKSTVYRFLAHLEREGYLVRDGEQAYVLGIKFIEMAARGNWVEGLRSIAWPLLLDLQRATSETVNLAILDHDAVLYVEVLESPHAFRLVSTRGMKRPLHCTALGKALLAFLPAVEQERMLAGLTYERITPQTITSPARFRKALARIRDREFAVDDEAAVVGARCIAAPILDSKQRAIAAISIAGPVSRITRGKVPSFTKSVQVAAAAISAKIRGLLYPESAKTSNTAGGAALARRRTGTDGSTRQFLLRGPPSSTSRPNGQGT
jgi:DNA-binding IclR family transcriptional regulator